MNRLLVWYGELASTRKLTARGLALLAVPLAWIVVLLVAPLGAHPVAVLTKAAPALMHASHALFTWSRSR